MNKKAVFFSTDAIIALIIIFLSILVIFPVVMYSKHESDVPSDVIKVLSSLKIGEINNSYVSNLTSEGKIQDLNKSVLEQIGEFYVTNITIARTLADSVLSTIDERENIGLWFNGELLASRNITPLENSEDISVDRQIISGISGGHGESVTGFSARAYLTSALQKKYFYFGGYVGDGNISVNVNYSGNIQDMSFEIATNREFDLYINENNAGHYDKSPSEFQPAVYNPSYESFFHSGENIIKLVGTGGNLYIAGGFLKITYNESAVYEQATKYYFPGIEGLINIYDGFYSPGQISDMEISLHYNSNYTMFLNIGNVTVFIGNSSGQDNTTLITSTELQSKGVTYPSISNKTIPIRLGLENVSYAVVSNADVISVIELGGSTHSNVYGKPQLEWIKNGNYVFVNTVLNSSVNRVGFVAYNNGIVAQHNLSSNATSLNNSVFNLPDGNSITCICCGINGATQKFLADWNALRYHAMILMSDGKPSGGGACFGVGAIEDAIEAACRAYEDNGIKVNVIGYGKNGVVDENVLKSIASCGHGSYYYSNETGLAEAYKKAAEDIIEAAYQEQTMLIAGNVFATLYPNSYIKFSYIKDTIPYGMITTTEKQFDNNYTGNFSVPAGSKVLETKVVSYSGPRWTDNVNINSNPVYKLSNYGSDYTKLGDPYAINIPNSFVLPGNAYIVNVTTGTSPTNSTYGSRYNKIIYTLVGNTSSYSPIVGSAKGCIWTIGFDDGTYLTNLKIPEDYSGADNCYYNETAVSCGGVSCENSEDAIQIAVYKLLLLLDLNSNHKVDSKFTEQDLNIDFTEITGIPYAWSTEIQVRKWA